MAGPYLWLFDVPLPLITCRQNSLQCFSRTLLRAMCVCESRDEGISLFRLYFLSSALKSKETIIFPWHAHVTMRKNGVTVLITRLQRERPHATVTRVWNTAAGLAVQTALSRFCFWRQRRTNISFQIPHDSSFTRVQLRVFGRYIISQIFTGL